METTYALSMVTAPKRLNGVLIARCNDGIILIKHGRVNVCEKLCGRRFTRILAKSHCVHVIYSSSTALLGDIPLFCAQAFSVFFVCVAFTSDIICLLFIPVQWLFFAASTYVWVQYVWHTGQSNFYSGPTAIFTSKHRRTKSQLPSFRSADD